MLGYQSNIKHQKLVEDDGGNKGNERDEYIDIELGKTSTQLESISMTEADISSLTSNTSTSTVTTSTSMVYAPPNNCGFKCGRCLRGCCDIEGSFLSSRPCDEGCRCTCLSTAEVGATTSMFAGLITAILGICCMGCEQCCRPR